MVKQLCVFLTLCTAIGFVSCTSAATQEQDEATALTDLSGMLEEQVSSEQLLKWKFVGAGKFYNDADRQVCLEESVDSKGVTIISPDLYKGDVVMQYQVMTLTPATVMVNLLSLSDKGASAELTLPENYDGNMGYLVSGAENYFIAYRNSPHATAPFIRKYPDDATLVIADEDNMIPGVYYDVEVGRRGKKLWLKINDELIVETTDEKILSGGHVAIRTRGITGYPAACLIRGMVIYSAK